MRNLFGVCVLAISPMCVSANALPEDFYQWSFTDDVGVVVDQISAFSKANFPEWALSDGSFSASGCDSFQSVTGCWSDSVDFAYQDNFHSVSTQMTYSGPAVSPILTTDGIVHFWYEVVGPTGATVPLDFAVTANVSANGTGNSSMLAIIDTGMTGAGTTLGICAYTSNPATCEGYPVDPSLMETVHGTVLANVPTEGSIDVSGGIFPLPGNTSVYFGSFGSVDPEITIDPSFTLAGYSLIFGSDASQVPGFSPGSSVPEPETITLLFCGLVALVFSRTGRRSVAHTILVARA